MVEAITNFDAADVNQGSSRVLYVEGKEGSVDATVLSELLPFITIRPIGPSFHVKAAADAFRTVNPRHFFLIDRDHETDAAVEKAWRDFGEGKTNLLIWHKKEIENYFLDPGFLLCSEFVREGVTVESLQAQIADFVRERIYMFAANRVITHLREKLKRNWITLFVKQKDFPNAEVALKNLLEKPALETRITDVENMLSREAVEDCFRRQLALLLGDATELEWGEGRWLELVPGKGILNALLQDATLFNEKIPGQSRPVQGAQKVKLILQRLLRKAGAKLPQDFVDLRGVLKKRLCPPSNP